MLVNVSDVSATSQHPISVSLVKLPTAPDPSVVVESAEVTALGDLIYFSSALPHMGP
jgi:hypothetical protein